MFIVTTLCSGNDLWDMSTKLEICSMKLPTSTPFLTFPQFPKCLNRYDTSQS